MPRWTWKLSIPICRMENDTIYSFLLLAGYLTLADTPEETEIGTFARLRLPNTEIRRIYNTEVLGWIRTHQPANVIAEEEV